MAARGGGFEDWITGLDLFLGLGGNVSRFVGGSSLDDGENWLCLGHCG